MKSTKSIQNIIKQLGDNAYSFDADELRFLMYSPKLFLDNFQKNPLLSPKYKENQVIPEAIIEISNDCENDCAGCEIRESNYLIKRFHLNADEIINAAKKISNAGINSIILKTGQNSQLDTDIIAYLVYSIKNISNTELTLATGLRNFDEYRAWRIAGADNYFIYDCCDRDKGKLFNDIDAHIKYLKRLGYKISLGKYLDIKNDEVEELIDFILLCEKCEPDLISIEPVLNKLKLYDDKRDLKKVFAAIALLRAKFLTKSIVSHYSYDSFIEEGCQKAVDYGSNVYLMDYTPQKYLEMNKSELSMLYSQLRINSSIGMNNKTTSLSGRKINQKNILKKKENPVHN